MNTLKAYKAISFILLPFGALLGIAAFFEILLGLMNIAVLLQGILLSLTVVYIILSFIFLIRGINQNKKCKPKLRKWIRTTGLVTVLLALNLLFGGFYYLVKPLALSNAISGLQNFQKEMPQFDVNYIESAMKTMLYVIIFFATTLIIHYIETTKFLKIYTSVFDEVEKQ